MMDKHHPEKSDSATHFTAPRHWVGPEELEANYWSDQKVQEKRGQEFFEKPVEWLEKMDQSKQGGIARRDFLTIMGASMAMASFSCARRPVNKIIPYVVKPEEITPGVANWYASVSRECPCGCGILVKTREGRPIKIEGNPDHPVNRGALCTSGQASVLSLYDPDRLAAPVSRAGGGSRADVSWDEADKAIAAKLKEVAAKGGRVRIVTPDRLGPSATRLVQEFLAGFSGGAHVSYDALGLEEISVGQNRCYGTDVTPQYHFDKADVIVSLGADFMSTWLSPIEFSADWAKNRKLQGDAQAAKSAKLSKVFCFEPTMTNTGASADERYPIRPGDELKIALSIANEILTRKKPARFGGDGNLGSLLSGYSSGTVSSEIGLPAGLLAKVADELWAARGKSLVVGGSIQSRTRDSVALQVAINLLNSMLENEGVTVDGTLDHRAPTRGYTQLLKLIDEMKSGSVDALILYRVNPAYTLPKTAGDFDAAVKKVPLVVAITDREDETGLLSHYVLPDHHYLENWGDDRPRNSLYALQQPAIAPIHQTRAFEDTLLSWIRGGVRANGLAARIAAAPAGANTWHDYLKANWQESMYRLAGAAGTFEQFWEGSLRKGVLDLKAARGQSAARPSARNFQMSAATDLPRYKAAPTSGLVLALYSKVAMYDGRGANNPWLQELPDPISTVAWDNYLNVSPKTAAELGLKNDDVVAVKSGEVSARLPVRVQPGMHPGVVSAAVGYGRRAAGKVGTGAGVDVYPFAKVDAGKLVYSGHQVSVSRTQESYRLAAVQWHNVSEKRPVINDITLAEYKANPAAADHSINPHLRMEKVPTIWPVHEYKGHRWGMSIDLNSCVGCGACMVACQAENNIPVVGRQNVRVGRSMHWIRIDRYYSGSAENPDVLFEPMLCQHCENAPCETVCPVLATVHDDEGLNVQVYNRCVGTRYCQNNCPYKVRRFNFFDHWKAYEGTMNLAWNPDVTVRTRGIMEKCTFCVQRIRDAKEKVKDSGQKLVDGAFKVACQQTCPTNAITFGDMNDPKSAVSKLRADDRAFRVLEVLNTRPAISYLTKVRNKEGSGHSSESTGKEQH